MLEGASQSYGTRKPSALRVVYLCGPEPENDLSVLLSLGVKISNIWAVEGKARLSQDAVESVRGTYPDLKIFPGSIEAFCQVTDTKFDIVYLDFTGGFISDSSKPYRALHAVFTERILAPLGALITNFSVPDFSDDEIRFLAAYFWPHAYSEKVALGNKYKDDEEPDWVWTDGPISHDLSTHAELEKCLRESPHGAYSSFLSSYPAVFASEVLPWIRMQGQQSVRQILLSARQGQVKEAWERLFDLPDDEGEEEGGGGAFEGAIEMGESKFALSSFLEQVKSVPAAAGFRGQYDQWCRAVQLRDVVVFSLEGFEELLSARFRAGLENTLKALPDCAGGVFTDVPLRNLWAQYAAFQIGSPWHANYSLHRRWEYTAKVRTMYLDVHIFDQARPLYDEFGLFDLLGSGITDISRQLALRTGIDSLRKHGGRVLSEVYLGGNIVAWGRTQHSENLSRRGPVPA
jgi:hypothetical protein